MSKNFFFLSEELADIAGLEPTCRPLTCTSLYSYYYHTHQRKKVEDIGVEPMTLCVQGRCSSQLS